MVVAVMVVVAVVAFFPRMQSSWGGGGMVSRVIPCLFFLFFISNVAIRGDQCHSLGHGSVCIGSTN